MQTVRASARSETVSTLFS